MYLKKEDAALDTFSFDFKGNDVNFQANSFQSSQDRPFAELVAKHLGTHHTLLECDNETQADYLFKAVDARDFHVWPMWNLLCFTFASRFPGHTASL